MPASIEDVQFLARSEHRVAMLDALAEGAMRREDLQDASGASGPTVGRILGDFEERGWVERDGHEYGLTRPGAFVAERFLALLAELDAERRLRDVWRWLPGELDGFSLDLVADATVTVVEPGDPYGPANRCSDLYGETSAVRGFDAAVTAPHHFERLYERIVGGMRAEFVFPPSVSEKIAETYPGMAVDVVQSGNLDLWLLDGLPLYRVTVFDDRVGIGGYDPDTGVLHVYVDTAAPEAREWATATFEAYREEARRLTA